MLVESFKKPGFDYIELRSGTGGRGNSVFVVQSQRTGGKPHGETFTSEAEARRWVKDMNNFQNGRARALNDLAPKLTRAQNGLVEDYEKNKKNILSVGARVMTPTDGTGSIEAVGHAGGIATVVLDSGGVHRYPMGSLKKTDK